MGAKLVKTKSTDRRRRRICWFLGIWLGMAFIAAVLFAVMRMNAPHRIIHPKQFLPDSPRR
jgi:hypothetical protein